MDGAPKFTSGSAIAEGPREALVTASNERRSIAKCTVIITYLNDNAQTPLNRLIVYMLYSQLCNTYGDKWNRWSLGLI